MYKSYERMSEAEWNAAALQYLTVIKSLLDDDDYDVTREGKTKIESVDLDRLSASYLYQPYCGDPYPLSISFQYKRKDVPHQYDLRRLMDSIVVKKKVSLKKLIGVKALRKNKIKNLL